MVPTFFAVLAVLGFVLALLVGWHASHLSSLLDSLEFRYRLQDGTVRDLARKGVEAAKRLAETAMKTDRAVVIAEKAERRACELLLRVEKLESPAEPDDFAAGYLAELHAKDIEAALLNGSIRKAVAEGFGYTVRSVFPGNLTFTTHLTKA